METFQLIAAVFALFASGLSISTMQEWLIKYKYRAPRRLKLLTLLCFAMSVGFILMFI